MPFLSDQKNWRASRPPPTLIFFPKSTDQNFEIAILFNIVENHNNYVLGMTYSPTVPRGGVEVTNFNQCLHIIMVIGKCTDVFRGIFLVLGVALREGAMWEDLSLEKYAMGEKNSMKRAQDESGHVRKKRQIKSLIYNAGCSEPLYYGV